jgi:hypothetical protein
MGSAGWVTTTVNYLWPLSLSVYAILGMVRSLKLEHIPWYCYILYAFAGIYGCNNELVAVMVLAACMAGLLYAFKEKRPVYFPLAGLLFAIGGILFALSAPGNNMRLHAEILKWMPDFPKLSFFGKLRIGFLSTFEHFVSIPNTILFLLNLLICSHVFLLSRDWMKRKIGLMPICIQVVFSTYFFLEKVIVTKDFRYSSPELWPESAGAIFFQVLLAIAFLAMIICLTMSLYWTIENRLMFFLLLLTLGTGLATRLSLSFSPTVLVSGSRTYLFLYMAMIAVAFFLWKKGLPKKLEYICFVASFFGISYNIIDVIIRQRHWLLKSFTR